MLNVDTPPRLFTAPNTNPQTGIRYGVISMQSLDSDLSQELFYGPDAVDIDYTEAYEQAKIEAGRKFDDFIEEAQIAAAEVDSHMSEREIETFIENWLDERIGETDREMYVESELEEFSDCWEDNEPTIEGEHQGVKYRISWLGGAPILWVFESPHITWGPLCSPCIPGAVDLDSTCAREDAHQAYDVPTEWRFFPF